MKSLVIPFCLGSFILLSLGGCATWTDGQRASLQNVGVNPVVVNKDAFHPPNAMHSPGMSNTMPMATGGGFIPALMGSIIDSAVTNSQQNRFEKTAREHFDALQAVTAATPGEELRQALVTMLQADPFFGSRLGEQPGPRFQIDIYSYGLSRAPGDLTDNPELVYALSGKCVLRNAKQEMMCQGLFVGLSQTRRPIEEIAQNPAQVESFRAEALADFVSKVRTLLDGKLGRTVEAPASQ